MFSDWGDGEPAEMEIEGPNPFGRPAMLVTPRPFTHLEFRAVGESDDGRRLWGGSAAIFLSMYLHQIGMRKRIDDPTVDGNFLDLDVVYVGQSLATGGALGQRLANHSTLQRILADTQQLSLHLEVWVVVMRFASYNTLGTSGPWSMDADEVSSEAHLEAVYKAEFGEKEVTALTEAALIRYFQPEYNKVFKYHFPKPLHESYRTVYDLDLNSVGFEFESFDPIGCRLKSEAVEPDFVHTVLFSLDENNRERFFNFQGGGSGSGDQFYVERPAGPPSH